MGRLLAAGWVQAQRSRFHSKHVLLVATSQDGQARLELAPVFDLPLRAMMGIPLDKTDHTLILWNNPILRIWLMLHCG
jgi:hypothetical protein